MGAGRAPARVLVVGGNGRVGAPLVSLLAARGADVRAATPSRPAVGPAGLRRASVRLDLTEPRTWAAPLAGVERVFLLRPSAVVDVHRHVRPFLERAADAGVRHVVFQSIAGAHRGMPHGQVEADVDAVGLARVFLRPTMFHQRLADTFGDLVTFHDTLRMPAGRGRTAFVDARDVAEVAADLLLAASPPPRATYTLTGDDSLTGVEIAELLSRVLGREIRFEPVSLAQYRKELLDTGADLASVRVRLLLNASSRLVLGGATDPTLARLLRRQPTTLETYLGEHRERWAAPVR